MADAASAHQVAHLFRKVLGVIPRALQRLRHEKNVETFLPRRSIVIFQMPHENEIAQAVKFGIRAQHRRSSSIRAG